AFNRFILQANLQEIPLGGCSFTWCYRSAKKMSKLDRFLMSEGLLGVNPNFSALTLDRMEIIKYIQEAEKVDNLEAAQKAKIKWAIEGDENIKFYHGILNKKRNQLGIRGVLKDGDVLNHFGFGAKWCGWIQECLRSSYGSVLVNRSLTEEFQFYKGLKQGDPLSHFLFIFVMESLHLSFKRVKDVGMFIGIKINSSMTLSHMFYADDAIFMGQWSKRNIDTLMYMLQYFERASGLSINFSKSKFMGLVVSIKKIEEVMRHIGCGILNTLFSFLGSKVGGCMSRIKSWDEVRVIHTIHGVDGRIGRAGNVGYTSIWCDIINEMDRLASPGIDLIRCHVVALNLLDSLEGVLLNPSEDRWSWDLNGSREFLVASTRRYIDNNRLPDISSKTRWIKEVPIKVNVHA
nr:RNA-directed DNA polymerase, eukaryota, reverse transcriptase zinc-binding domain protein [Tanacetum cinerariifolium]